VIDSHLFVGHQKRKRFYVKGIAFPNPPTEPHQQPDDSFSGWNAVLRQLANETDVNVVRMYEMDCNLDYTLFLETAAKLGIYVLVPLTQASGDGVLSREKKAPDCYPKKLYQYGSKCIQKYWDHPNVLAGVIGNEVMNDMVAWQSAPCIKSYLDDLTEFSQMYSTRLTSANANDSNNQRTAFPLMYATQHDSPNAQLSPDEAVKVTLDYLACSTKNNFIFGINIESWCSSVQTFEYNEDGVTESSYHLLWKTLTGQGKTRVIMDAVTGEKTSVPVPPISSIPVTVPIVFSEMGCSKALFNRDNAVQPKYVRDWKQIPLVLKGGMMSDVVSGFVAYSYDGGGSAFRMMGGLERWDGKSVLPPLPDYENFRQQLSEASRISDDDNDGDVEDDKILKKSNNNYCHGAVEKLTEVWNLNLYSLSKMPSYFFTDYEDAQLQQPQYQKLSTAATANVANVDLVRSTTPQSLKAPNSLQYKHPQGIRGESKDETLLPSQLIFLAFLSLLVLSIVNIFWHRRRQRVHLGERPIDNVDLSLRSYFSLYPQRDYQSISSS